jgi:4-amino-4-deoxychorismate lyase
MNSILGKRELNGYPWARQAEGLFLEANGYVAEGIVSNVFFVKHGVCYTPSIETGILPGITRGLVLELAERLELEVRQGLYTWDELSGADEVFITNSIQEIVPITTLYDTAGTGLAVGNGTAGPVTRKFIELYRQEAYQIKGTDSGE